MEDNRNLFITIGLSVLILALWQVFYMNPRIDAQRETARIEAERQAEVAPGQTADPSIPAQSGDVPGSAKPSPAAPARDAVVSESARVKIDTPALAGSINLTGSRIDDLKLKDYRATIDPNSPNIELLNPSTVANGYFAEIGYVGNADSGAAPGPATVWQAPANAVLTENSPVILTFTNDKGVTFERTLSVDDHYMFTFTDKVINASSAAVSVSPYGRVTRFQKPTTQSIWVIHEGLIGFTGEEGLQEVDYGDIEDDQEVKPGLSNDGWLGITDKYWGVALVPDDARQFQPRFAYFADDRPRYQTDYLSSPLSVQPGGEATVTTRVFAGAKEVQQIAAYQEQYQIRDFDRLIDWGWFYFITKPLFYLIDWLYKLVGNFGIAILVTTVIVKLAFFPLANKSYVSMANMKKVQPKMMEIKEKYGDDRMKQQQAMMELYKKEKINPVAGCWPMLIQIPVFFALYKVLYVTIEMRHAPFFGWIQDLAAPDPTSVFNLFGLLPFEVPAMLMIGIWPLIMGITMFLQMQMNPAPPDPTQAMIFKWMPVMFTFMLATFPAGLVIYWAWNNTLTILQQGFIMKRQGAKIELWDNLARLFKRKPNPAE